MSSILCCSSIQGYKNKRISHEAKFDSFMSWLDTTSESTISEEQSIVDTTFVIQLVRQVNFGSLESKRYFAKIEGATGESAFVEVSENWLIDANFQKLNAFKNYKCAVHNKFFEINVYEKDPVNLHHWRANVARPATEIDL